MAGEHLPVYNYDEQPPRTVVSKLKNLVNQGVVPNLEAVAEHEIAYHGDDDEAGGRGTVIEFLQEQGVDIEAARSRVGKGKTVAPVGQVTPSAGNEGQSSSQPGSAAGGAGARSSGTGGRASGSGGAASAGTGGASSAGTGGANS